MAGISDGPRGSYFRQFWDVSERVHGDETPEELKDAKRLHQWGNNDLGENRVSGATADPMVLVVRGDLLKRYPGALIYTVGAVSVGTGDETHDVPGLSEYDVAPAQLDFPVFRVTLPPDLTFFGFSFTEADARDKFFIIEERVGDARFGLDTPNGDTMFSGWDDLSWQHFGFGVESEDQHFGTYLDSPPDIDLPEAEMAEWNNAIPWAPYV